MKLSRKTTFTAIFSLVGLLSLAACTSGRGRGDDGGGGHTHVFETVDRVEPKCEEPGVEKHKVCLTCNKLFDMAGNEVSLASLSIDALGHQESNFYEASNGKHYHVCLREGCGKHLHEEPHTPIYHMAHSATCMTPGNIEYYTCSVCNKYFSDEACIHEISASSIYTQTGGHHLVFVAGTPADCSHTGTKDCYQCTECHKYFSDAQGNNEISAPETVPTTGHNVSSTYQSDDEHHWQECSVCHEHLNEGSHSFSNYNQNGDMHTGTCTVCGKSITEAHTISNWIIDQEATYESTGLKHGTCTKCGANVEQIIPIKEKSPQEAIDAINKISSPVTEVDDYVIKQARTIYQSLSNSAKSQVSNYAKLQEAEETYNATFQKVTDFVYSSGDEVEIVEHHGNQEFSITKSDKFGPLLNMRSNPGIPAIQDGDGHKTFAVPKTSNISKVHGTNLVIYAKGLRNKGDFTKADAEIRIYDHYEMYNTSYTLSDVIVRFYYSTTMTELLPQSLKNDGWSVLYADKNGSAAFFENGFATGSISYYVYGYFTADFYLSPIYGVDTLKDTNVVTSGECYIPHYSTADNDGWDYEEKVDYTRSFIHGSPIYMDDYRPTGDYTYTTSRFDIDKTTDSTKTPEIRYIRMDVNYTNQTSFFVYMYTNKPLSITRYCTVVKPSDSQGNVLTSLAPNGGTGYSLSVGWNKVPFDFEVATNFFSNFDNPAWQYMTFYFSGFSSGTTLIVSPIMGTTN